MEAERDPLLPLLNKKAFIRDLDSESKEANEKAPLCLIFVDLDHFKKVNDGHGHECGDQVLIGASEIINSCVRGKGMAYRYGGEELTVILPNYTAEEGTALAERIRLEIEVSDLSSKRLKVTASIGVASMPPARDLVNKADKAMYAAKKHGRNLVWVDGQPEPDHADELRRRKPAVKQAEPGGFSDEQMDSIRENFFKRHGARCPHDRAALKIEQMSTFGQRPPDIWVTCPLCGSTGYQEGMRNR